MISVDWLQFYCLQSYGFDLDNFQDEKLASIKADHGSKVFSKLYKIIDKRTRKELAICATAPYSDVIKPNTVIVKFNNELLYLGNLFVASMEIISRLHLTYKGITRLDLAFDCNRLYNGLLPSTLIRGYVNGSYVKKGVQRAWYLHGTQNFQVNSSRVAETDVPISEFTHTYDSITWGGRKSAVHCQIYDKTKELREVHDKPWIRNCWRAAGLDENKPIWRFEIRIAAEGKDLLSLETGEFMQLGAVDLISQERIEEVFQAYAQRYFDFAKVRHISRKSRLTSIKIFSFNAAPSIKPKHFVNKVPDNRYLRGVINYIDRLQQAIESGAVKTAKEYDAQILDLALEVIRMASSDKQFDNATSKIESGELLEELYLRRKVAIEQQRVTEQRFSDLRPTNRS